MYSLNVEREQMNYDELKIQLEALLDRSDPYSVLLALSEICQEKAEHIAENWQDASLARTWRQASIAVSKSLSNTSIKRIS